MDNVNIPENYDVRKILEALINATFINETDVSPEAAKKIIEEGNPNKQA
jgi:hypothetical protein